VLVPEKKNQEAAFQYWQEDYLFMMRWEQEKEKCCDAISISLLLLPFCQAFCT